MSKIPCVNPFENTAMQNAYNSGYYPIDATRQWINSNPYASTQQTCTNDRVTVLQKNIEQMQSELDKLTLDKPLPSPTQRMLNTHESLKNAYEEMLSISKLVGVKLS